MYYRFTIKLYKRRLCQADEDAREADAKSIEVTSHDELAGPRRYLGEQMDGELQEEVRKRSTPVGKGETTRIHTGEEEDAREQREKTKEHKQGGVNLSFASTSECANGSLGAGSTSIGGLPYTRVNRWVEGA